MPADLSFFDTWYTIFAFFGDLMEFRRFGHRKLSQSDAGMNLAFFKFDGIIGKIILGGGQNKVHLAGVWPKQGER